MQIYTTDKTSPRGFPWLWYLRLPAIAFSVVVLGITANDSSAFSSIGCNAPAKLSYNLAVAVISFFVLVYFLLSTGPKPQLRLLPWFLFGQLGLDAFMFVLWLAASASSSYSCNDLCSACNYIYDYVVYDTEACICVDVLDKRSTSPKPNGMLEGRTPRARLGGGSSSDSYGSGGSTIAAKQAFDAIMTVKFAVFVGSSIFFLVRARQQSNSTTAPTTGGATEIKHAEAGMPAGGAVPTTTQQPATNTQNYTTQPMPQQPPPQAQYVQSQPEKQPYTQTQAMPQQPPPQAQYVQTQPEQHQYTQTQTMPQTETVYQTEHIPQQADGPTFVPKDGAFVPKENVPEMPSDDKAPTDM